jgi:iron-sulfur cluster repair protein YtfE (RIC family)
MDEHRTMEHLRVEHAELRPRIQAMRLLADRVGAIHGDLLREELEATHHFLVHELIPHAEAEDRALYPAVGRVLGAPLATATMTRDHAEIDDLTEELAFLVDRMAGDAQEDLETDVRRVLYGLYHVVRLHVAKEEEIYLPILEDGLTPDEAGALLEAMERSASAPTR